MVYHSQEHEVKKKLGVRIAQVVMLLLVAVAAVAIAVYRNSIVTRVTRVLAATEEDPVPIQALQQVSFQTEIPSFGEIVGLQTVPVPTPSTRSGALKVAWLIPEGTPVNEGDVVIRFDSTNAKLTLEQQQNTLASNQEKTKVTTGNQKTDEVTLAIDKTDAEKDYEYAMTVLPQDATIFSQWDIIEAQINAGFAKEKINSLVGRGKTQRRIARSDQQLLNIEKSRAQTEISITQQTLDSLELKAPTAGLLVYRRDRNREPQVGDDCQPGQVITEVVDLNALQARIYVLERDAGNLTKDKPVVIRMDSIPEKEFHGVIHTMTALAQPIEIGSVMKYFTCDVTIGDAAQDLRRIKPGMALKGYVILEKCDSCFVVPASAVTVKGVETLVHIREGDKFVPRPVTIGSESHGQIAILRGVKEREIIALRDPFESRKAHLPDFSKASAGTGGPGMGGRGMMMGGPGPGHH